MSRAGSWRGGGVGGFVGGWGGRGELVSVDAGRDVVQWVEGVGGVVDAYARGRVGVLVVRESGVHDCGVRVDRVFFVVGHGSCTRIGLRHLERRSSSPVLPRSQWIGLCYLE